MIKMPKDFEFAHFASFSLEASHQHWRLLYKFHVVFLVLVYSYKEKCSYARKTTLISSSQTNKPAVRVLTNVPTCYV